MESVVSTRNVASPQIILTSQNLRLLYGARRSHSAKPIAPYEGRRAYQSLAVSFHMSDFNLREVHELAWLVRACTTAQGLPTSLARLVERPGVLSGEEGLRVASDDLNGTLVRLIEYTEVVERAASASAQAKVQRVGRFVGASTYLRSATILAWSRS